MSIPTSAIGAAMMALGAGSLIASNLQILELQFELNEPLPNAQKFEPPFWWFGTYVRLRDAKDHSASEFSPQESSASCGHRLGRFLSGGWTVIARLALVSR